MRWTDEDGGVNYTAGKWKSVDDSLAKVKKEKTVKIVQRGQAFRDKLLEFERCCSISGENTCSALEAAHLIASKSSGAEIRENGILLRADLHRLYDAGQFTIDPKGRIVIGDGLSKDYQQQLRGKRLSAASYGRVQRALQKIAQDR